MKQKAKEQPPKKMKKYVFTYSTDEELMKMYERHKTDLYWLVYQCEVTTGQPHAIYYSQWQIEVSYGEQLEQELRNRGKLQ
jgi:hypothetical protein